MIKVRDIMTRDVLTLAPDVLLADAAELLTSRHVSGAPVISGGRVVGVLSATDILQFVAEHSMERIEQPESVDAWTPEEEEDGPAAFFDDLPDDATTDLADLLELDREGTGDLLSTHRVDDVMTRSLISMTSETDVPAAADYMRRTGVHRILVVDDDALVGILSSMDVVRAVAEQKVVVRRFVFEKT